MKSSPIPAKMSVPKMKELINSKNYLFHVTSEKNADKILKSGFVLPKTFSGSPNRSETHSSFTEDPVTLLQQEEDTFGSKKVILIFDKNVVLKESDVKKVEYKPRSEYNPKIWWEDDRDLG